MSMHATADEKSGDGSAASSAPAKDSLPSGKPTSAAGSASYDPEKASTGSEACENVAPQAEVPSADVEAAAQLPTGKAEQEENYPSWKKVIPIMGGLYCAMLLVALDRTIIATAIPTITDQFDSLNDVGWYGSAYLLTSAAFMLPFGRVYTFYSPKHVFLAAILLFEVGSAVCGAAPNSTAFILGRAIAGLGSSGIFGGAIVIVTFIVPLRRRPLFAGFFASVFGIASVMGPLVGGALTNNVTWRWCFLINLPIGAFTIVTLILFLHLPSARNMDLSLRQQLARLDPLGAALFLPGVVCLFLALQWGGSVYPWSNGRVIALLVLFGILMIGFIAVQIWKQESATVPPRILKQRSIASGTWFALCVGAGMMVMVYFIPLWFQAIKGVNALDSGIRVLPLVLSLVVSSMLTGICVHRVGYYTPFLITSSVVMSVGAGLLTTFTVDTEQSRWIAYQFLYGYGIGLGMQQSTLSAQTVLDKKDVATGVSLMFFAQTLGGATALSIAQNIFTEKLVSSFSSIPGFDPSAVVNVGATEIRRFIPPELLDSVLVNYNSAVVSVFYITLATACASIIGGLGMEWKSVKGKQKGGP